MPSFNEMRLLNGFLLVFSVVVTLFLLIGAITDTNRCISCCHIYFVSRRNC